MTVATKSTSDSSDDAPIPMIITFDAEPDSFFIDPTQPLPWSGLDIAPDKLAPLRDMIGRRTGHSATFSWLIRFDEQVRITYGAADWCLHAYSRQFDSFRAAGDQFGAHAHPYRLKSNGREWVHDYGDEAWVRDLLGSVIAEYRRAFDRPPGVFSFGFDWMSNAGMTMLREAGVGCDMSLIPGTPSMPMHSDLGEMTGERLDYRMVPRHPYYPSAEDFRVPDASRRHGTVCLPLTINDPHARPAMRYWPKLAWRRLRGTSPSTIRHLLRLGPMNFQATVDRRIRCERQPYFVFQLRAAVCAHDHLMDRIRQGIKYLLDHPAADRFRFVTAEQALELLGFPAANAPGVAEHRAA